MEAALFLCCVATTLPQGDCLCLPCVATAFVGISCCFFRLRQVWRFDTDTRKWHFEGGTCVYAVVQPAEYHPVDLAMHVPLHVRKLAMLRLFCLFCVFLMFCFVVAGRILQERQAPWTMQEVVVSLDSTQVCMNGPRVRTHPKHTHASIHPSIHTSTHARARAHTHTHTRAQVHVRFGVFALSMRVCVCGTRGLLWRHSNEHSPGSPRRLQRPAGDQVWANVCADGGTQRRKRHPQRRESSSSVVRPQVVQKLLQNLHGLLACDQMCVCVFDQICLPRCVNE